MTCSNHLTMLHLVATVCYWALDIFCKREWGVGRDAISACLRGSPDEKFFHYHACK